MKMFSKSYGGQDGVLEKVKSGRKYERERKKVRDKAWFKGKRLNIQVKAWGTNG